MCALRLKPPPGQLQDGRQCFDRLETASASTNFGFFALIVELVEYTVTVSKDTLRVVPGQVPFIHRFHQVVIKTQSLVSSTGSVAPSPRSLHGLACDCFGVLVEEVPHFVVSLSSACDREQY